ncbi:MAG: hypothetical protein FJ104_06125 [Deltaproteobacteria bacterium]|nr:hypothetical protein [Deltaproteobacteria bacterium]
MEANYVWGDGDDDWPVGSGTVGDITSDSNGNVYVNSTYGSTIAVNGVDYAIGRFGGVIVSTTSAGVFRWATNFGAAGSGDLSPQRVIYDPKSDAIYVVGTGWGGAPTIDSMGNTVHTVIGTQNNSCNPFIARLSVTDGSVVWAKSYNAGTACAGASGIAVSASGEILIGGGVNAGTLTMGDFSVTSLGTTTDGFVARLNAATGAPTGMFRFGNAAAMENVQAIIGLPSGNVVVAGNYNEADADVGGTALPHLGGHDGFWGEFTSTGTGVRAGSLAGVGGEEMQDVKVGPSGDYYVAGYYTGSATMGATTLSGSNYGVALARISASTGDYAWVTGSEGGGNAFGGLRRIVVDSTETVRFAVRTSAAASGSTLAGFPIDNSSTLRVARVSGATGVALNVETILQEPMAAEVIALTVLPDGRAAISGFHTGIAFAIDGVNFGYTNTTCCPWQSRDQWLAVLRAGL